MATGVDDEPENDARVAAQGGGDLPLHLRVKLNLERLGHAEFFRRELSNGWKIVPPVAVVLPGSKGARALLCGARSDQLLGKLYEVVGEDRVSSDAQVDCPDRIVFEAGSMWSLFGLCEAANLIVQDRGIERLLVATPPVDNFQLRLPAELPFGEDWNVKRFSPSNLKWAESSIDEARRRRFGLFQIQVRFRPEYFLKFHSDSYRLPVQVGKYIALGRSHQKVLRYDYGRRVLSVPVICRPPLLLDRALTLCTGLVPDIVDGYLEYRRVEPEHYISAKRILRQ